MIHPSGFGSMIPGTSSPNLTARPSPDPFQKTSSDMGQTASSSPFGQKRKSSKPKGTKNPGGKSFGAASKTPSPSTPSATPKRGGFGTGNTRDDSSNPTNTFNDFAQPKRKMGAPKRF